MVGPRLIRAALAWVVLLILGAGTLLLTLDPGTPEFVVSLATLLLGVLLGLLLAFVIHLSRRKT